MKMSYAELELFRKLSGFNAPIGDMKQIHMICTRSLLEQSNNVRHSGFTIKKNELERVQKVALKLILKDKYKSYENAINFLEIDTLIQRRIHLSLSFSRKFLKTKKDEASFPQKYWTQCYEHKIS